MGCGMHQLPPVAAQLASALKASIDAAVSLTHGAIASEDIRVSHEVSDGVHTIASTLNHMEAVTG